MADAVVDVVVQIAGDDVRCGRLWSHRRRGTESATFAYADEYLARPGAYAIDPAQSLVAGRQQTVAGKAMFGAMSDCSPDRWGRRLILRAERDRVRREGGTSRSFGEIDYLLGVRDDLRQGSLRFRDPATSAYHSGDGAEVPMLVDLPALLNAAERLDRDEADEAVLRLLLRGGSSLGGARPKAHVRDRAGRLAIAKFPSASTDDWDVIRWEAVALELAREAGIRAAGFALHPVDGKHVLVVDRFDREGEQRIGYVSAMTMIEAADGDTGSYLEVASAIEEQSPAAVADLRELWRRVVFSVLISNTDDHLRNHGFLRTSSGGWTLSPAFDLNPNPEPGAKHLSTAIDQGDTAARIDTVLAVAPYFRLAMDQAVAILRDVSAAAATWSHVAQRMGLSRPAIEQMSPAFEHEAADSARAIVSAA